MNKAFWKYFETLLGKIYLFLIPNKTKWGVPSQQGTPTTCNQTYWEVSQQTYFQPVWVWSKSKIQPFIKGGGSAYEFERGLRVKVTPSEQAHSAPTEHAAILYIRSPQTPWIVFFLGTLSFQRQIIFSQSPSQQTFPCRTYIFRSWSIGCPCNDHSVRGKWPLLLLR